jgi:uncharacterized protein YqjF (DUF2071 family)
MNPKRVSSRAADRPWPAPREPWIMRQTWQDLLFAHWPMPTEALRERIPAALTLDTFDGEAWLGIVPFRMAHVHLRGLPPVPTAETFPELNLRTYVTYNGTPGVWFFSLDAASRLAVRAARLAFHLPYFEAQMQAETWQDGRVQYRSLRVHPGSPPCELAATYAPTGTVFEARRGSLEEWLTARYCLYSTDRTGRLYRGDIHHVPWPLQPAEAAIERNSIASLQGFTLPDVPPLLHFSGTLDMICWRIRRVR